jgi:hypothetical protein
MPESMGIAIQTERDQLLVGQNYISLDVGHPGYFISFIYSLHSAA